LPVVDGPAITALFRDYRRNGRDALPGCRAPSHRNAERAGAGTRSPWYQPGIALSQLWSMAFVSGLD